MTDSQIHSFSFFYLFFRIYFFSFFGGHDFGGVGIVLANAIFVEWFLHDDRKLRRIETHVQNHPRFVLDAPLVV